MYDVGGGRTPVITPEVKRSLELTVVGIDCSLDELSAAPAGAYDRTVVADICSYRWLGDGDLVVCRNVLEHVSCADDALRAIASLLKPGGKAALFVPNRHSWYARLNRSLPHAFKVRCMAYFWPEKSETKLFPA